MCGNIQNLKNSKRLAKGELDLYIANGSKVVVVGTYEIVLPSGLILYWHNCYQVPTMSNIISDSFFFFFFIISNDNQFIH